MKAFTFYFRYINIQNIIGKFLYFNHTPSPKSKNNLDNMIAQLHSVI